MNEHILKSELFCNRKIAVNCPILDQNTSILDVSCEYKKICGYEVDLGYAHLKNIYIYTSLNYFIAIVN